MRSKYEKQPLKNCFDWIGASHIEALFLLKYWGLWWAVKLI